MYPHRREMKQVKLLKLFSCHSHVPIALTRRLTLYFYLTLIFVESRDHIEIHFRLPSSKDEAYAEAHDPRPRPVGSDPYKAERQSVHAPPARFPQVPPRPGTGPPGRGRHVESWSWRIGRCGHSPRRATQCASKFKPSHQTEILTPLSVRMRRRGVYTPLHVYYASPQAGSL